MPNLDAYDPGTEVKLFPFTGLPAFRPANTAAYDPVNSLWLLKLCHLIYRRSGEVKPHAGPTRMSFYPAGYSERAPMFSTKSTQAVLVDGPGFHVLVFRGTEVRDAIADVVTDARALLVPWPPRKGLVHAGFRASFVEIWNAQIAPVLRTLTQPLFITGHSLGGALATLAAAACRVDGIKLAATYTFGAPRVGDDDFCKLLSGSPFYRVVNDKDVVCTVPLALGYRHHGTLVQIADDGKVTITKNPVDGPSLDILKKVTGFVDVVRGPDLYDHAAASYGELLRRAIKT